MRIDIPDDELHLRFTRSSGPGGQNVNKRSTRVEITFDLAASRALSASQKRRAFERLSHRLDARGLIHVSSSTARTQEGNRRLAVERLHGLLAEALRPPPPPRRATKPSARAVDRRIRTKRARGATKALRGRIGEED